MVGERRERASEGPEAAGGPGAGGNSRVGVVVGMPDKQS